MVVFGGADIGGNAKADIYILDTITLTWTAGTPAASKEVRANMACAVAGDSFIAWGGKTLPVYRAGMESVPK